MSIGLVYLSYTPFGTSHMIDFIESYISKKAGIDHKLVILFNGYTEPGDIDPFIEILNNSGLAYEHFLSPEKFDIVSYFYIARILQTEFITFINTYSIILQDNWLLYLYRNLDKENVGIVGASGGWGAFGHNDEYRENVKLMSKFTFNLMMLKKMVFFRFNFYPKVKPHLRTNVFMIRRKLFLSVKYTPVKPWILNLFIDFSKSKLRSLCFEHGNDGFTSQLMAMGYKPLVVDKYGNGYEIGAWKESRTFWSYEQENLLVSDNQTLKYQNADDHSRKEFTYSAWGD